MCNGQACHLEEGRGDWKYSKSLHATENGDKPWTDGSIGSNTDLALGIKNVTNDNMLKKTHNTKILPR